MRAGAELHEYGRQECINSCALNEAPAKAKETAHNAEGEDDKPSSSRPYHLNLSVFPWIHHDENA
jgi:hypothetical protein